MTITYHCTSTVCELRDKCYLQRTPLDGMVKMFTPLEQYTGRCPHFFHSAAVAGREVEE